MLNTLSTSIGNIVSLLLQTLRLASFLPALYFVAWHQFGLPRVLGLEPEASQAFEVFQQPVWTVLLTIIIGYTLNVLNMPIIRFFEGYPYRFTQWGTHMVKSQVKKKRRLEWLRVFYRRFHQTSQELLADKDRERKLYATRIYCRIAAQAGEVDYCLEHYFPERDEAVLPTKLGNSIAAFEEYPGQHYGIEALYLWSHLLPVLSETKYSSFVEREKSALDFMLNMSLLTFILAGEGIVLSIRGHESGFWLFAAATLAALLIFYRGSIAAALNWGETVKAAFDLYRHDLAKRLSLRPVWSLSEEKDQWEKLSTFIQDPSQGYPGYDYPLPRRKPTEAQDTA